MCSFLYMSHTAESCCLLDYYNKVFLLTDCFIVTYCPSMFNIYAYKYLNTILYIPNTKEHSVRGRMFVLLLHFRHSREEQNEMIWIAA